tara:strand:- start:340 stop:465 length:126 start_codon:yes stop_codon:yes gene_type:complete
MLKNKDFDEDLLLDVFGEEEGFDEEFGFIDRKKLKKVFVAS